MQILHSKSVFFKINLEDCKSLLKIYFEDLGFSLQMALHVFSSILKINFKDHFFSDLQKKSLIFFFQFFFFNFFIFNFTIFRIDLQKKTK